MITVPEPVLAATFDHFRDHGRGKNECVVYWIGPNNQADRVDEVVHPVHTSHGGGYQIDDAWLTAFWFDLAARRKSVRLQVHTHPGRAFHSDTDDEWPILPDPGFLSLVIPNFGLGSPGFDRAYLARRSPDGGWIEVATADCLEIEP